MARMITKAMERRGRKKIAKLLLLMGFRDDHSATTTENMLARLRRIQEKTKVDAAHERRPTIKKLTIKFDGKTYVSYPTKVPLGTAVSEIMAGRDDDMEVESSDQSSMMINCDDEGDQSFEENRLIKMIEKNSRNEDGAMEFNDDDNMEAPSTNLPSENPASDMTRDIENNNGGMEIKDFIISIGGSEVELVIKKTLTKSDCNENQGRLLMPLLQVKNTSFLSTDEKKKLDIRESISVDVFDPERRKLTLNLAQWRMKNENYVLKTNWRNLVLTNGLKEKMVIQVWSFRVDQKLCFAVVRV